MNKSFRSLDRYCDWLIVEVTSPHIVVGPLWPVASDGRKAVQWMFTVAICDREGYRHDDLIVGGKADMARAARNVRF
jgi:hypothetical protein